MNIPADFQFTDNTDVNIFAEGRAEMMFGKYWKSRTDLKCSRNLPNKVIISNKQSKWSLQVGSRPHSMNQHKYSITSYKNGYLASFGDKIEAKVQFDADGKISGQTYCIRQESPEEIAERMAVAKRDAAKGLCAVGHDIVALCARSPRQSLDGRGMRQLPNITD